MSTHLRTLQAVRPTVKRLRDRFDDPEVRNGRRLVRALRDGPPDVVVFGDSTWLFVAPYDDDQRRLSELVEERLPPGMTMASFIGAGYNSLLMRSFVHLLREHDAHPVVVIPLTARLLASAWRQHPKYNYERPSRILSGVDDTTILRRIRARGTPVTNEEFAAYAARPIETWAGSMTIGELRSWILDSDGPGPAEEEARRMLYAYHYGEEVRASDKTVGEFEALGRALGELGVDVVAYETGVPIDEGVALWGEQFRERTATTFGLLRDALRQGMGTPVSIIESGTIFKPGEFIDLADGSEHLNQLGRQRYADLIAGRILKAVSARSPG